MDRRYVFGSIMALLAWPMSARAAQPTTKCFKQNQNDVEWTVPSNINRIRVESWSKDGDEVIDTHFRVRPGQKFKISAVDDNS